MAKRDLFYMSIAQAAASQSKDPHTHVGACIIKDGKILSMGWNGAPRNFPDDLVCWSRDTTKPLKEQKYPYLVHAEMNAILNYGGSLKDFEDSTVYVTVSPCCDCAKMLAQLKISEVVYETEYKKSDTWEMAKYMFDNCGIKYRKLGDLIDTKY